MSLLKWIAMIYKIVKRCRLLFEWGNEQCHKFAMLKACHSTILQRQKTFFKLLAMTFIHTIQLEHFFRDVSRWAEEWEQNDKKAIENFFFSKTKLLNHCVQIEIVHWNMRFQTKKKKERISTVLESKKFLIRFSLQVSCKLFKTLEFVLVLSTCIDVRNVSAYLEL